ncbi:DUF3089 domain-containing protein [Oceanicoccus sp. KOV_DT_Chl]|uniref:DUF3089 domain-containing protein n=1 Tax=Oceanicoccus sp. KOV_DT_Chl TaxID=1904639 RepID=UPI000C7DBE30|nr:DUF3089 domain-containing protein [Oceanicoccus sp. KOV_DT_Chl]
MAKIKYLSILLALLVVMVFAGKLLLGSWMMSVPAQPFANSPVYDPPDYNNPDHWAALPDRDDGADWLPANSTYKDNQFNAKADVFYVYPTAGFYGDGWNVSMDNWLERFISSRGSLPQQATPFNGVAKIYAPHYRSVRMSIWTAEDRDSVAKATDLAYQDVKKAFDYYLANWNKGRPIILVSHSQGTLHLLRLLQQEFDQKPLTKQLVAAYIIGNTVPVNALSEQIPLCQTPQQTHCYVTWNTVLEGGSSYHWVEEEGLTEIACVNPLSWKADLIAVDKSANSGSIPLIGLLGLAPLDKGVVGARCGPKGILWIAEAPKQAGYNRALFAGGQYHTYDINFYYHSIRTNAELRLGAFLSKTP